jgi:hypothetical protein
VTSSQHFNTIKPDTFHPVLDLQNLQHNDLHESSRVSQVLLNFPIIAELIEEMMLSRYHLTSGDEQWSEDALSFLSCALTGSSESLMKVRGQRPPNTDPAIKQTSIVS